MLLVIEIIYLVISYLLVFCMAIRRIQFNMRRTVSGDFEQDMMGGNRQWIPLKLNASGVMPIIFAQAIMFIPAAVAGLSKSDTSQSIVGALVIFRFWYNLFATFIVVLHFLHPLPSY
jgi:preprotein translocase subunit SecY